MTKWSLNIPVASCGAISNKSQEGRLFDHIAFDVDDIENTFSLLKNAGFSVIEDEPVFMPFLKKGGKYFNVYGPD